MKKHIILFLLFIANQSIGQTVLPARQGGTGLPTYTIGDIIYASAPTLFSRLPIGSSGQVLTMSGGLPSWQANGLSAYLPLAGTLNSAPLTGTIEYRGSSGTTAFVDTVADFYWGAGNRKNLGGLASTFDYIQADPTGNTFSFSSYNGTNESDLFLSPSGGFSKLRIYGTKFTDFILSTTLGAQFVSTYTNFIGANYSATTAGYVLANQTQYSLLHRAAGDARWAPISVAGSVTSFSYTNGNGFTGTVSNPSTTPTLSLSLQNATTSQSGQLTSTDWNTFNGKQTPLSGTGYVYQSGSTTSYTTSIPNSSLANSTFTVNGTGMALGTSSTVTAAAGTLTGTALNSTVVTSSLTTVGTLTTGVWNATAIGNSYLANSTISGVSLGSNLSNHTTGYGLSGSTYNGSGAISWTADSTVLASKLYVTAKTALFGLTTSPLSQFASTTSAQLASTISNETGTSLLVYNTSPTLVTPLLGTPTSGVLTNCTGLPFPSGITGTYTVGDIFQASSTSAVSALAAGAVGTILRSTGTGSLTAWSTATYPNTVASGNMLFATGTNAVGSNTTLTYDAVSMMNLATASNVTQGMICTNSSAGNAAYAENQFINNNGKQTLIGIVGGGVTTSARFPQDGSFLYCTGSGGLAITSQHATTGTITFLTGGIAERARFDIAGHLGLGVTSVNALLHISAGTATANTAPIKLTSGTLLTTAEAGVLAEYDGTNFYTTPNTTVGRWPIAANSLQYTTPVTTNTVTATAGVQNLVCNPVGTIAALTITFPSSPVNGQVFRIAISQIITVLTLGAGTDTVDGTIVTTGLNSYGGWVYSTTATTWFKTQ